MRIWIAAAIAVQATGAAADPDHCKLAVDYAAKNDLPRAGLHYEACEQRDTEELRGLARRLDHSELARIVVSTDAGVAVEISALPGERFDAAVWVSAGSYELRGTAPDGTVFTMPVEVKPYSRGTIIFDVPKPKTPPAPKVVTVEVGAGGGDVGDVQDGPPPDIKHPTLLPKRYRDGGTVGGDQIDDPLATRVPGIADGASARARIGLRIGLGVASASDTATAFTLGVAGSRQLAPGLRAVARVDWSRRSHEMGRLDAIGASGGIAARVATAAAFALDASASLRPELRLGDTFMGRDVHRVGLGADLGLDVILRGAPLVFGLRADQGVTRLASGTRERALLVEVSVELR